MFRIWLAELVQAPVDSKAKRGLSSLLCLWVLIFLSACGDKSRFEASYFSGDTMGTTYNVTVVRDAGTPLPADLGQSIHGWLDAVNQSMSTYLDDSELARLNAGPVDEWLPVSPMMAEVLTRAREVSKLTGGAFDITIAPLVDIWGFGPVDTGNKLPDEAVLARVKERVGFEHLKLRRNPPTIRKTRDLQLDLSAIAKGFAADYVGRNLAGLGLDDCLVEIGGDLLVKGHNPSGEVWRIGVETPSFQRQGVQQAVLVTDSGLATSGDYRNFFQQNGQIYTHIIDPRLGRPVKRTLTSVTVIADSAALADALATGLAVLGAEEALSLAEQRGIPVYLIVRGEEGFETLHSAAFAQHMD